MLTELGPMRDVLVYLSGPITARDGATVEGNVASGLAVYLECVQLGIPAICPHLSAAFPSSWQVPYEQWMALDLALIARCTHVLLLPGWQTSPGARREIVEAERLGLPVVRSVAEIKAAA